MQLYCRLYFPYDIFAQKISSSDYQLAFSAIKGKESKPDSFQLHAQKGSIPLGKFQITGQEAKYFRVISSIPPRLTAANAVTIVVVFIPAEDFIGIARAALTVKGMQNPITLTGLSTKGLEGPNEAPLALIVDVLGYGTNVGWSTLDNHLRPELQGEEIAASLFTRAGSGKVEMIPVARYSPDFLLNYGYYTNSRNGPIHHQTGILASAAKFPEHQTLFPGIAAGGTSFDPGESLLDSLLLVPDTLSTQKIYGIFFFIRLMRPILCVSIRLRLKNGSLVENSYLVCIEEASNGDYNDYVFVVKNVRPVLHETQFQPLLNGVNLNGWYTWLQSKGKNNDPENIFTVGQDGVVHDQGKEVGYIMTEKRFENFHFTLEFKWGEKDIHPVKASKRDSGICYNMPDGEPDHIWPQSVECQIQEGDVGDFWLLENSTIQVDGKQNPPSAHTQIVKKKDAEKEYGMWNTVEVISFYGKCVHIVNGVVVNYGENASLIGGRILLQSEYAEIFYRNVRIRELK